MLQILGSADRASIMRLHLAKLLPGSMVRIHRCVSWQIQYLGKTWQPCSMVAHRLCLDGLVSWRKSVHKRFIDCPLLMAGIRVDMLCKATAYMCLWWLTNRASSSCHVRGPSRTPFRPTLTRKLRCGLAACLCALKRAWCASLRSARASASVTLNFTPSTAIMIRQ